MMYIVKGAKIQISLNVYAQKYGSKQTRNLAPFSTSFPTSAEECQKFKISPLHFEIENVNLHEKKFLLKNFFYFSVPLISYISLIYLQWGLVCDREFVGPLITTTYFCGVMLGGIFFGSLSDKFGRKNMMLICLYTQCVIGIGIHFVRRLVVFIGLRFIQGIFIQVSTKSSYF